MTETPCKADSLYLNTYVVMHTGVSAYFRDLGEQIDKTDRLVEAMTQQQPDYEWLNIIQRYRSHLLFDDKYGPAKMDCLFAATIPPEKLIRNIDLNINGEVVYCEISSANIFIYPINTGLIEFKVVVPEDYWQNTEVLQQIISHLNQAFISPDSINAEAWSRRLNEIAMAIQQSFEIAANTTQCPQIEAPFVDLREFMFHNHIIQGSHVALVAVLPEGYNVNGLHYQKVMLDNAGTGVFNHAKSHHEFVYTESFNSLFCMARHGQSVEEIEDYLYDEWLVWMQFHEFSWKMVWDLDRVSQVMINCLVNGLDKHHFAMKPADVLKVNRFMHYLWLCMDDHHPRNLASFMAGTQTYYIHLTHYMLEARKNWHTDTYYTAVQSKMQMLEKLVNRMYAYRNAKRSRMTARILGTIGVVATALLALIAFDLTL